MSNKIHSSKFSKYSLAIIAFAIVSIPTLSYADTLTRHLSVGMSGSDVSSLQTFLAKDSSVYPQGLVTGYFGFLTKAAVSNFQSNNSLPAVGQVGPATLALINQQMINDGLSSNSVSNASPAPIITNVSVNRNNNNATVSWNTNEYAKGVIYYSTNPLTMYEYPNSADISGNSVMSDANFHTSQSVSVQNLQSNTVYYYLIYSTDQSGNVSVTWPSTFQTTS